MSYYYRDINGTEHTDKENSFTKAYEYKNIIADKSYANSGIDSRLNPIIAIKDGTKIVYPWSDVASFGGMPNFREAFSHVYMAMASFSSSNQQYDIENTSEGKTYTNFSYGHNNSINIKELYKNNEPIINYVDRTNGNMLSWTLNDDLFYKQYEHVTNGPHSIEGHTTQVLRMGSYEWGGKGNDSTTSNWDDFPANLLGPGFNSLQHVRTSPKKQNNKFGYTEHILSYEDMPDTFSSNRFSYFTLNINDIRQNNNKLKLNYYYTIHFDPKYIYTNDVYLPEHDFNTLTSDWESNFTTANNNKAPFSFNYFISNNSTWDFVDENKPIIENTNLTSTYCNTNDTHEWKGIARYKSNKDDWNDIETLKRLYVGHINKNDITYTKFTNFKGSFYCFGTDWLDSIVDEWNNDSHYSYRQRRNGKV